MSRVSYVAKGDIQVWETDFEKLKEGDIIFTHGVAHMVGTDAHYSGDASYEGYLLYDTDGNSYFPEDLDQDVAHILLDNLKEGDRVLVSGDSADLWISDYNVRVYTCATVEKTPAKRSKKVLVTLDSIDGDANVMALVKKAGIYAVFDKLSIS